jgi:uncharacterized OB-fold protein
MVDHSEKNFPVPTKETARYWEGCRNHELLIQQCAECRLYQFYPRIICTGCMSAQVEWVQASGRGKVISFTIMHRAISHAYAIEAPYVIALIKLDEGPTMMSNIVQLDPENVVVGMTVEVVFEDWSENISIPKFRPIRNG